MRGTPKRSPCRHCGQTRPVAARGLCHPCYETPGRREQYGKLPCRVVQDSPYGLDHEPTEAELDAIIEEQRKCLPANWAECEEIQEAATYAPIPTIRTDRRHNGEVMTRR